MNRIFFSAIACLLITCSALCQAETDKLNLEQLLESVKTGKALDQSENSQRLMDFKAERKSQQTLLNEIIAERQRLEALSDKKEAKFEANDLKIGDLEKRLSDRMGSLKELFGVLQQVSGDAQAQFHDSLGQLDASDRREFLVNFSAKMGEANRLPELTEIERVWVELLTEMTLSSQVVTRDMPVVTREGAEVTQPVTRIGLFNAVSEGVYLKFIPETGRLVEYPRQPSSRYLAGINELAKGDAENTPVAIDPVRGQLIDILTQAPNLYERVSQGGTIGAVIIALGIVGALLALYRLGYLFLLKRSIDSQLANIELPDAGNPLGRILLAGEQSISDVETLELKLGEAVMQETPKINAYIPLLKIIAAVAPLMGLLGTVTGMIVTFQAITLFGAGDPRLMAGGISQALMTTVLGLCVAVPMLLLHNIVQMQARTLTDIVRQKAVAVVAAKAELFKSNESRDVIAA